MVQLQRVLYLYTQEGLCLLCYTELIYTDILLESVSSLPWSSNVAINNIIIL